MEIREKFHWALKKKTIYAALQNVEKCEIASYWFQLRYVCNYPCKSIIDRKLNKVAFTEWHNPLWIHLLSQNCIEAIINKLYKSHFDMKTSIS